MTPGHNFFSQPLGTLKKMCSRRHYESHAKETVTNFTKYYVMAWNGLNKALAYAQHDQCSGTFPPTGK